MGTMAVAGVLIWSKLRLATNIPRSAYAVPEQGSVHDAPAVGPVGTDAPAAGVGAIKHNTSDE